MVDISISPSCKGVPQGGRCHTTASDPEVDLSASEDVVVGGFNSNMVTTNPAVSSGSSAKSEEPGLSQQHPSADSEQDFRNGLLELSETDRDRYMLAVMQINMDFYRILGYGETRVREEIARLCDIVESSKRLQSRCNENMGDLGGGPDDGDDRKHDLVAEHPNDQPEGEQLDSVENSPNLLAIAHEREAHSGFYSPEPGFGDWELYAPPGYALRPRTDNVSEQEDNVPVDNRGDSHSKTISFNEDDPDKGSQQGRKRTDLPLSREFNGSQNTELFLELAANESMPLAKEPEFQVPNSPILLTSPVSSPVLPAPQEDKVHSSQPGTPQLPSTPRRCEALPSMEPPSPETDKWITHHDDDMFNLLARDESILEPVYPARLPVYKPTPARRMPKPVRNEYTPAWASRQPRVGKDSLTAIDLEHDQPTGPPLRTVTIPVWVPHRLRRSPQPERPQKTPAWIQRRSQVARDDELTDVSTPSPPRARSPQVVPGDPILTDILAMGAEMMAGPKVTPPQKRHWKYKPPNAPSEKLVRPWRSVTVVNPRQPQRPAPAPARRPSRPPPPPLRPQSLQQPAIRPLDRFGPRRYYPQLEMVPNTHAVAAAHLSSPSRPPPPPPPPPPASPVLAPVRTLPRRPLHQASRAPPVVIDLTLDSQSPITLQSTRSQGSQGDTPAPPPSQPTTVSPLPPPASQPRRSQRIASRANTEQPEDSLSAPARRQRARQPTAAAPPQRRSRRIAQTEKRG